MLEKIVNKISKGLKLIVGGALLAGATSLAVPKSEASIIEQEYIQNSQEPIITKLDYRGDLSSLDSVGTTALYYAQSFIALDNFIIDGSLKLRGIDSSDHNMYLKVWPHDSTNNIPDINNPLGTTTNELTSKGTIYELFDYYLREFGFSAVQVTSGERYWLGLYNPDINGYGIGKWSIYGNQNPYPDGYGGHKPRVDSSWEIYYGGRDLGFSVTFSNVNEPSLLGLLSLGGLASLLAYKRKIKNN